MKKKKMLKVLPISIIGALILVIVTSLTIYGVTMEFIVHSSADFDIKGGGIQTTYSNNGYATVLKVGSTQGNVVSGNGNVAGVTCKTTGTLVNGGSYVKVNYQLINTNDTAVTVSLASHADTQVGSDDSAAISTLSNNRGISMTDGTNTFQLLLAKTYGVTDVDSFWFGQYGSRTDNLWNQVTSTSLTGVDSGLVYAWQNRTIEANSEINLSVLFGVGKLNEPPTITLTNTLESEYNSNESIPLVGNVNDIDNGDSLTIKYALDGGTECTVSGTYIPNGTAKPYSTNISLPSGITQGQHKLQIWVTDSTGNMSEVIERTFNVNIAATVTSHYYYKDSTEVLAADSVFDGYVSQDYTTSAKEIDGYELVATPSNATGTITDVDMHVYYYYVQKIKVTTKYVDKLTGDLIEPATEEEYLDGQSYTTAAKTFSGYELVTTPSNASGTAGRSNLEVVYEYKKKSAGVEIKYIDQSTGETIAETITKNGLEGDPYTSEEKGIDEYELVKTPDNANGNMTVDKITVVYEYRLLCTITTQYIDENYNTNIVSNVYQTLKEGDTYTTEEKNFAGYKLTDKTTNTSGTVERTDIVVTYKYKKISEGIEVKYVDQFTGEEIHDADTQEGLEKDPYTTTPVDVDGYRLASTPVNANGQMGVAKITVTYPYKKISKVTTKFINKITKEEIHDEVVEDYVQGDVYNTTPLTIDGYEVVVKPSNVTGVIGRSDIIVTYEYKRISEGVEIRFVDQANGNSISSSINLNGLEGAEYTSQAREIPGYELVVTPDNANGNMTISKITVTYEYRLNSYVYARYVDEYSGRTLKAEVKTKYKEGDPYTTTQENIDGYTFSRVEGQATGTVERTNIYVTYYYKKNTSVIVQYVDMLDGNREIHEQTTISGVEGQDYNVEVLDIPGFAFIRSQGSRDGQMEADPITIVLRYKKLSNLITQHVDVDTGDKICEDVVEAYKEGEDYACSSQNIPGYVMVEEPTEKAGKMGREDIVKVYKYKRLSEGLVVRYVDKYSNEVLEEKTYEGNVGDKIETEAKSFMHYIYDDGPHGGEVVLTPELTEVTYYYIRSIVMHVVGIDEDTKEPLFDITRTGPERDYYKEEPKEIEGYKVVEIPANAEGYYDRTNTRIEFIYKKIDAKPISSVNVKYVDKETSEVLDEVAITGEVGKYYRTERKSFENYELAEIVGSEAGNITEEEQNVTYYYTKKKGTVAVTYINESGNRILREEFEGKVGQDYNVTIKELDGYIITEYPTNTQGKYKDGTIEIIVKMKRDETQVVMSSVLAQYIDKDTGIALIEVLHTGENGEEYRTERKTIENYELLEVVGNEIGTITEEQQVVKYYYVRKDGLVNVIYEDQDGNIVKTESLVGKAGKRYKVTPENLVGYEIVELPDNMSGKYGETPIDVVIKVQKIQVAPAEKGTIIIELVDKEGNTIGEKIVRSGNEGEKISIELPDVDGYKLIGNKNITVTFEAGEKHFKAVYEKEGSTPVDPKPPVTETGRVIIKLVDKDGNEIGERIIKEGNKGDKVSVVLPDIDGYILTQDKNVEYTIVKGDKVVNAIYEKVVVPPVVETGRIIVNLVDKNEKVIGTQIIKEGNVGDKVKVELPEIKGYKITGNKTTEYVFVKGDKVVNAVYEKDEEKPIDPPVVEKGKIIVNLVDKDGKVIGSQIVREGKVGDKVKVELPEIDGYKITGDKIVQYTIKDGETQVMAVYEKIVTSVNPEPEEPKQEEAPNTGDENIALLGIIALVSTLTIVKTKKELFNK